MKKIMSFASLILAAFVLLSSCAGTDGIYISEIDETGMSVVYGEGEVRTDFLKAPETSDNKETFSGSFANVRDFGAVGDGVTDDVKACKSALASLKSGGTLYFPAGTYKLSRQLFLTKSNTTICGDGSSTTLLYTYEQREIDPYGSESLISGKDDLTNITIRDLRLEYTGSFFPKFGDSYTGKINGIYFTKIDDLVVENIEVTGFNASGIDIFGLSTNYCKNIIVNGCYSHHNRLAGVEYGYVDGILITNCVLEYNGSKPDGGTGYGVTGRSSAKPMNIRVINNECNYNYRKGIDFHAAENIVVEGNTLKGNRLYGIYCEGPYSHHIVIKNNYISGMNKSELDIGDPYTWISGICVGTATDDPNTYFDFEIVGNTIDGFGLGTGDAYAIQAYMSVTKMDGVIKDNVIRGTAITSLITFSSSSVTDKTDIGLVIEGNYLYADTLDYVPITLGGYNTLVFENNNIIVKDCGGKRLANFINDRKLSSTIIRYNNVTSNLGVNVTSPFTLQNKSPVKGLIQENNFHNGKKFN